MKKVTSYFTMIAVLAMTGGTKEKLFDLFHPDQPNDKGPKVVGALYTMTNDPGQNELITYQRLEDASIIGSSPVTSLPLEDKEPILSLLGHLPLMIHWYVRPAYNGL